MDLKPFSWIDNKDGIAAWCHDHASRRRYLEIETDLSAKDFRAKKCLKYTQWLRVFSLNCAEDKVFPLAESSGEIPNASMCAIDVEAYVEPPPQGEKRFPKAGDVGSWATMISLVFKGPDESITPYLLTTFEGIQSQDFNVEKMNGELGMIRRACQLIRNHDPHVILGHNMGFFDIPFLEGERRALSKGDEGLDIGMKEGEFCELKDYPWSLSPYIETKMPSCDGRVFIDTMIYAKKFCSAKNHKLQTLAEVYLGSSKDPVSLQDIWDTCEEPEDMENRSKVAAYCVQDAFLCLGLERELDMWRTVSELSELCDVPPQDVCSLDNRDILSTLLHRR